MAKRPILPPETLSEDSFKVLKLLNESSDLSAVLVATSYLDASLAGMLHKFFIVSQTSDRLLDTRGALGTFVARADAAYALGLISKVMYQCLTSVGEIRNEFAHHHLELSFASLKVQELCGKLNYIDACFQGANPPEQFMKTTRDRFVLSVVLVSQQLLVLVIGTERRNEIKAFSPPILMRRDQQ